MIITRRLEFDAGHRIPNHNSLCKHLHGHRYAIEITLSGDIIANEGQSEQGMVMDFTDIQADRPGKSWLTDGSCFPGVWRRQGSVRFSGKPADHRTVILDVVPTAKISPRLLSTSSIPPTRTPSAITCAWRESASTKRQQLGGLRAQLIFSGYGGVFLDMRSGLVQKCAALEGWPSG